MGYTAGIGIHRRSGAAVPRHGRRPGAGIHAMRCPSGRFLVQAMCFGQHQVEIDAVFLEVAEGPECSEFNSALKDLPFVAIVANQPSEIGLESLILSRRMSVLRNTEIQKARHFGRKIDSMFREYSGGG